ncbi:hypothetical protein Golob_013302 [Gossypium lobatum]|uniref:Calcineurin-like phosphoesterase domain-containing protein n=1 Tax=Gossypium lobatum TaxID=34289 RepID=A0A7J8LP56_9ROSI|nr:hypothetical protein [Gossypium lobatum]
MAQASSVVYNNKRKLWVPLPLHGFVVAVAVLLLSFAPINVSAAARQQSRPLQLSQKLRFGRTGEFKILQVADMHYADGKTTPCLNVLPSQVHGCSDLNTSAFIQRMIQAENPNLIVFTGDNIFGFEAKDSAKSLNAAFGPAIAAGIPWAAVLGNHDQQGTLSREGVMKHIVGLKHTLSQFNPPEAHIIDGFGNYNLEVGGVEGSGFANKSVLNLYFLDSGDYSTVPSIPGYGWIKPSQQLWFQRTSAKLQVRTSSELSMDAIFAPNNKPFLFVSQSAYMRPPMAKKSFAPGLVYFHIPLPEFASFEASNFTGVR